MPDPILEIQNLAKAFDTVHAQLPSRGNRREDIVHGDTDRHRFAEAFQEVDEASGWVMFAWGLMSNHYHFLFKTPGGGSGNMSFCYDPILFR